MAASVVATHLDDDGCGGQPLAGRAHGHTNMTQDLVFAVRLLRRHPAMFGITIAGLAVATGVTTAALSVAKSIASTGYGAAGSTMV